MLRTRGWLVVAVILAVGLLAGAGQTTIVAAPQAPTLIAPADGATLSDFPVNLEWKVPAGTTKVYWEVLPFNNDGPGLGLIGNTRESFLIPPPPTWYFLLPDMTYTWRVRATDDWFPQPVDDPSWSSYSPPRTFRTPKVSSAGLTPVTPPNAAVNVAPGPTILQWSHPKPEVFYWEIQVSGDNRFDTDPATATSFVWWNLVHGGITSPPNSWTTPPLDPGQPYYWRVRPRIQGDGTPVEWSDTFTFQTSGEQRPPSPVVFTAPANLPSGTVGVPYFFNFCTPHSGGATEQCPSPNQAPINPSGGNPPYHFQKDPGSQFWPFGLSLGKDGQLKGTPSVEGSRTFTICAVDLSENQSCATTTLTIRSAATPTPTPSPTPTATPATITIAMTSATCRDSGLTPRAGFRYRYEITARGTASGPEGTRLDITTEQHRIQYVSGEVYSSSWGDGRSPLATRDPGQPATTEWTAKFYVDGLGDWYVVYGGVASHPDYPNATVRDVRKIICP